MNMMRVYNDPFLRFLAQSSQVENQKKNNCFVPSTNVMEDENAFRMELMVPGFSKKDIKINVEKNMLTISSEKHTEKDEKQSEVVFTRREFGHKDFCRSFELPETVDVENIKADYKNGILSITLPKKEEVKIKKEIQIA